jgi:hypothetical protein
VCGSVAGTRPSGERGTTLTTRGWSDAKSRASITHSLLKLPGGKGRQGVETSNTSLKLKGFPAIASRQATKAPLAPTANPLHGILLPPELAVTELYAGPPRTGPVESATSLSASRPEA